MTGLLRPPRAAGARAGSLTGTARLIRLALRRDRILLPVWITVLVGLLVASVASVVGLYADEAARTGYATVAAGNAIARAFDGPMAGTSLGAVTMTEVFGFLAVLTGIMSVQAVVRHTRQDEETGRTELVGSAVVGRHAPLTAALVVAFGAGVVLGLGVVATFVAFDLPVAGAIAAGAAVTGVGWTFAAVAAVTAQVAGTQRGANGLGVAAVGLSFLLRAIGDAMGTVAANQVEVVSAWPSWLSPIGWGQQVRAFGGDRWGVLVLFILLVAVLVPGAFVLRSRRDVGSGLLPARPGPPRASRWLRSPLGLAWRLQRGVLLAWAVGLATLSAAFGTIGDEAGEIISTSEELATMLAVLGEAALVELFFAFYFGLIAIAAAGFAVQALLRARSEELSGRAEPVLATAVSRQRWLAAHLAVATAGVVGLLALSGLVVGAAYALDTGRSEQLPKLAGAALVHVPAALVLTCLVALAVAALPRAAAAIGWSALVLGLVVGQLGELFELPQAVLNLSPFTHTPGLPAQDLAWAPLLALGAVCAVLLAFAFAAFRQRDLTT